MKEKPYPTLVSNDEVSTASSLGSRRGVAILLLLSLAQFMDVLDASILNVGLPSIRDDLGFSQQSLLWVVNGARARAPANARPSRASAPSLERAAHQRPFPTSGSSGEGESM
jgi:hypothetical protein